VTLWVGTYREQGGSGLTPLATLDPLAAGEPTEAIANASFGVWSAHHGLAYFVDELEDGRVGAWRRDAGGWALAGTCTSGGAAPCFLSLSNDGSLLAVANYGDGTVGLIGVNPESGYAERLLDLYQGEGHGPDPERQEGPHAHCVLFAEDDAALYHVDLGTDRIYRHEVGRSGFADTTVAFQAPAGIGPRHLALLPGSDLALLVCELGARLLLLRREEGRFVCLDDVATAPVPCKGNLGGHLGLMADGDIYVTNRGHDSLVRFAIEDEKLVPQAWWPTGGSSPRHFIIDGTTALVAHEEGGGVTRLDLDSGLAGRVDIPAAAFLIDIPD
jgi:6-phosphogluconolactonase